MKKIYEMKPGTHLKPARYEELLQVLQKDFKVGCVIPYFTEYIHDRNGNLMSVYSRFSRSFTQNMVATLQAQLDPANNVTITDTGGTPRSVVDHATNFNCNAGAGVVTSGINWGRGTTAEATTQTVLVTPITNGSGANQITYGGQAIGAFNAGASSTTIALTRSGTSTAGVTVEERALYAFLGASSWTSMDIRDVAQVVVAALATITTVYTLDFAL